MTVRFSNIAALAAALSLGAACSGQTVDPGGAVVGPATGGRSSGVGGASVGGAGRSDTTSGGVDHGTGAGAGASGVGGASGSVAAAGATHGGSGSGGSSGSAAGGNASASGGAGGSRAGATSGGAPGSGGFSTSAAGSGGQSSAGTSGDAGGSSSAAPIPATWDTVKLVLSGTRPPCDGCHGNLGDGGFRITLDNDSQLFKSLTTTVVQDCGDNPIVTPGDPSKSALLQILKADCSAKTPRMPPGCVDGDAGCVPPEYMSALAQWISDGAPYP